MKINAYAANLGWLFEDLKRHFDRHGAVASDVPLADADAWICIRTGEFEKSPNPSRTIVQVHDLYDHDVAKFIRAALVVFTHPSQHLHWVKLGFSGKHLTMPIGARSGISSPKELLAKPTLGFFCGETPRLEKRSYLFQEAVVRARRSIDFDVVLIGRNLEHLAPLGVLYNRAADLDDYARVDAIFTASISPAVPLSVYEACSIGLPVITTPRWFPLGHWPSVFVGDSAEALAAQIVRVLSQRESSFRFRNGAARTPFLLDDWISAQINHLRRVKAGPASASSPVSMARICMSDASALPCLKFGWSAPEPWGVWSDGGRARLFFDIAVEPGAHFAVRLFAGAFTHATQGRQLVRISVNLGSTHAVVLDANEPTVVDLPVTPKDLGTHPPGVWLDFEFPDACSPSDAGVSGDTRQLGISLRWAEVVPFVPPVELP